MSHESAEMQERQFSAFDARLPFYCAILASGWPSLLELFPQPPAAAGYLVVIFIPLFFLIPFGAILIVPAIQLRSRRLAARAFWMGPLLLIVHSFLGVPFTIDNRYLTEFPLIVPGGMEQMNPGGPIEDLLPQLAIYVGLLAFALRRNYGNTRIFGVPYLARVVGGGVLLLVALHFEIQLTTIYRSQVNVLTDEELRRTWVIASTSWLCLSGIYWCFVLGVPPEEGKVKLAAPPDRSP